MFKYKLIVTLKISIMSTQYKYKCENCGNTVITDDHGCECTSMGVSYLYHCQDCGMLAKLWKDITSILKMEEKNKAVYEWWIPGKGSCRYDNCCPICGSKNIHKWNPIDNQCPKCGGAMHRDNSLIIHTD